MSAKVYKIRHKQTGLFSSGGTTPKWTKKGKAWSALGHLKSHISQVEAPRAYPAWYRGRGPAHIHPYTDAEVVVFEQVEAETRDVMDLIDEVAHAKLDKEAARDAASLKAHEDREKAELARLRAKYPDAV